jgi:glycoprotein-N-acetylgalactosamine 3-beta-galactosyltransferase
MITKPRLILILAFLLVSILAFVVNQNNKKSCLYDIIETNCNYGENGPKILCAIYTHSIVHKTTLPPVHNTWAKRCDKVIYMTGPKLPNQDDDPEMPFVYLNITDDYQRITLKTLKTMEYIYDNLMNDFDWLVRANDDTFIIMEHLRLFLANKCADEKVIYGKLLRHFRYKLKYTNGNNSAGFVQGGSGFLISRESLRLFVSSMKLTGDKFCEMFDGSKEDQEISDCFRKLNIYPGETRDSLLRQRFFNDRFDQ